MPGVPDETAARHFRATVSRGHNREGTNRREAAAEVRRDQPERQSRRPHDTGLPIVVAAAVVERDGAFLLTRRLKGTHLAGTWEFPGGKCEPDETPEACLHREIHEELAVDVVVGERLLVTRHTYPERTVELHFFAADVGANPCRSSARRCGGSRARNWRRWSFRKPTAT